MAAAGRLADAVRVGRWDDLPVHQALAPVFEPWSSDPHWNDGYYFAWYRPGLLAFAGLRLHPNNNVMDGYAGVVCGGEQRSVRVSRAMRPRVDELAVGPLRLDVVEPMRRLRLRLQPNPTGVEIDVELAASAPPFAETPHVQRRHGRLLNHVLRYVQVARAHGELRLDGERIAVDGWHAARDHSWGIRSTMGPHVPLGGLPEDGDERDRRALRLWVPFEVEGQCGFFHQHEDAEGAVLDVEGRLDFADGASVAVIEARHELRYHPGTRRLAEGAFTLTDETGAERAYHFRVAGDPAHPQGFGYARGWSDGGQPGVYRGAEALEHERFRVDDPEALAGPPHVPPDRRLGGTEFPATLEGPGGASGMAHVEHMLYDRRAA
jgi:hypothetical protein